MKNSIPITLAKIDMLELREDFKFLVHSAIWKRLSSIGKKLKKLEIEMEIYRGIINVRFPLNITADQFYKALRYLKCYRHIIGVLSGQKKIERTQRIGYYSRNRKEEAKIIIAEVKEERFKTYKIEQAFKNVASRHIFGTHNKPMSWQTVKRIWYSRKKFVKT